MSRRGQFSNPINEHTSKVLAEIRAIVHAVSDKFDEQKTSLYVLEQAVEMNLWVQTKIISEGLDPEADPVDVVTHVRHLQQEYLAIVAITNFLQEMAAAPPEEKKEP